MTRPRKRAPESPPAATPEVVTAATYEPTDSLRPWPGNPRLNAKAIGPVADSIARFGFASPIVCRLADRTVIAGHTRLEAAKRLGLSAVPVRFVDLPEAEARALAIADNRTGEIADWDDDLLAKQVADLNLDGFDLNLLGFTTGELDELLRDRSGESQDKDPDETPEVGRGPAVTKPGDVWVLGEHRLLCGDSTAPESLSVIDGKHADMVWTAPPYNVDYDGPSAGKIANDSMSASDFATFLAKAMSVAFNGIGNGGACYVSHADTERVAFTSAYCGAGFKLSGVLIWVKNVLVLGRSDHHWRHEPILYGWKPGRSHAWYGGRDKTTVFEFDKPRSSHAHPTMKPTGLVEAHIQNSCKRGGVVLDLFGGSGTTLIACETSGRKARLVELDPKFCDVIVERWETFTGKKAKRGG